MKKILLLFIITISVLSCSEDMLNRYPTTSLVVENFYKTPADATQALVTIYNMNLQEDFWSSLFMSEAASDNCTGGAGAGDGGAFQRWDRGLQWPDANANHYPWEIYYGAIFRANVYLENEGLIDWKGNEALQIQYQAEARFLRAYFHFYLTRLFGEIPALTRTLAPDETPARTPAEELYSFIINDLKFCIDNGLSAKYGQMDPANWGHVTKWAAEAMIARVYLFYSGYYNDATIGDFTAENAKVYIDDVITNSGHDLVPEYASLWMVPTLSELGGDTSSSQYAGEENSEVVWSIRYESSGNPYGNVFHRMIGPRNINIDPYGQGWGAITVLPALWNAYDAADKRKTATILSWDDEGLVYANVADQAQYTGYNSKKYDNVSSGGVVVGDFQRDPSEDFMVIRFADVLLMGAELHLITGDNGTALTLTNRVRVRAFGDDTHNYASVTIDDILTERRLELACEGLRYWDILRSCKGDFSKLVPILTYIDDTDGGDYSQSVDVVSLDVDGNNFVATKGLFQIPQTEIDLMLGAIQQNPGYTSN